MQTEDILSHPRAWCPCPVDGVDLFEVGSGEAEARPDWLSRSLRSRLAADADPERAVRTDASRRLPEAIARH